MRIALDLDGCLSNYNTAFRQRLAAVANRHDPVPADWHPPLWDWPTSLGYSVKDGVDAWDSIKVDTRFWASLPAYPGVRLFLEWLWKKVSEENWVSGGDHEVLFLTDRLGRRVKDQSEDWIHRHGFGGKHPTVLICNEGKGEILKKLRVTHFLDDRPENVEDARKHAPACQTFLLVRPWNQDRVYAPEVCQIASLKDFQRRLSSEF